MSNAKLTKLVTSINKSLETIGKSYMSVGADLVAAKELHDKQKDFLAWAAENFSLGKSQVYKLMAVHTTFAEDETFKAVGMKLLYAMVTAKAYEGGENQELYLECKALAQNGEFSQKAFNVLTAPPVEPEKPKKTKEELELEAIQRAEAELEKSQQLNDELHLPNLTEEEGEGEELAGLEESGTGGNAAPITGESEPAQETAKDELIEQLQAQNQELSQKLQALLDSMNKKSKQELPTLPHFRSSSMAMRLGLAANNKDAKKVKEAYRELVKLGYGASHSAHELLKEAHDKLIEKLAK